MRRHPNFLRGAAGPTAITGDRDGRRVAGSSQDATAPESVPRISRVCAATAAS